MIRLTPLALFGVIVSWACVSGWRFSSVAIEPGRTGWVAAPATEGILKVAWTSGGSLKQEEMSDSFIIRSKICFSLCRQN